MLAAKQDKLRSSKKEKKETDEKRDRQIGKKKRREKEKKLLQLTQVEKGGGEKWEKEGKKVDR